MKKLLWMSLLLAPATPVLAAGTPDPELQGLRAEIQSLRAAYEARLQALEQRLQMAERAGHPPQTPAAAPAPAQASAPVAAQVATPAPQPQPQPQPTPTRAPGGNAFNPAIALILSGLYTRTSQDPATYRLGGMGLPAGLALGPGTRGFSLAESELALSANIDPWTRGVAHIALHPDNTVSVEQAYVQTTALGRGFTAKAGRFFSGLGYLNAQHAHTWDFVDNPLAYQAFLGTQLADDGVQLKWLAPTDQYLEFGAELGRGRGVPGSDTARNGAGLAVLTAHTGGDVGDSHNWRAGLSLLNAKASAQALTGLAATDPAFDGNTRVWVADAVWKWAPQGNATRTNFKLQGELVQSRRSGSLTTPDAAGDPLVDSYRATPSGWYVQGIYQFMPRWRVGLRTERLNPGSASYGLNSGAYAAVDGHRPAKHSLMVDHSPSEFSRLRVQFARDTARNLPGLGRVDNQLFLQYQMSLGAHGAHSY